MANWTYPANTAYPEYRKGGKLTKKGKKRRKYGPRPNYMNQNPAGMKTGPIQQRSIGNTPGGGYMSFEDGGNTAYESWYRYNTPEGREGIPDSYSSYDYQRYYNDAVRGLNPMGFDEGSQHFPDTYKYPWHPSFSDESIYYINQKETPALSYNTKADFKEYTRSKKAKGGWTGYPDHTMYSSAMETFDKVKDYTEYKKGGMLKRKDGSYSRRGLWDNIRANRGSGRKPTKEMLRQERKIRAKAENGLITGPVLPADMWEQTMIDPYVEKNVKVPFNPVTGNPVVNLPEVEITPEVDPITRAYREGRIATGSTEPMIGLNDPILLSMLPPAVNTGLMAFNVGHSLAGGNYGDAATQALLMAAPPIIGSAVKKGISYAGQGARYLGSELPAMATQAGNYIKTKSPVISDKLNRLRDKLNEPIISDRLSNKLNEIERNITIKTLNSKPALKVRNSIIQYLENQALKDPELSVFDPKKLKRFKRLGYVKGLEGQLNDYTDDFRSLVRSKTMPYAGRHSRTSLRDFLRRRYFNETDQPGNFVTSDKSFSAKVSLPSENTPGNLYDFSFFNDNPYSAGRTAVQLEKLAQNIPGKWRFDPGSLSGDSYPMWIKLLNKQNTGQFEVLDPQYLTPLNTLGKFSPLSKSYREYAFSEPGSPNWVTGRTNYTDEINNLAQSIADKYGVRIDPDLTKSRMMYPRFTLNKKYRAGGAIPWHTSTIGEPETYGRGGYTVKRSSARKGKTHVVIGPDGTKKYFGDSKLGQHPKDPARKKSFYARHAKNLKGNPYFRAFARATWADGGEISDNMYGLGIMPYGMGGHIQEGPMSHLYAPHSEESIDLMYGDGGYTVNPDGRIRIPMGYDTRAYNERYQMGLGGLFDKAAEGVGGFFKRNKPIDLAKDVARFGADATLSSVGKVLNIDSLGDVVKDRHYKTKAFDKASNVAGGLGNLVDAGLNFVPGVNVIAGAAGAVGGAVDTIAGIDKRNYDPSEHQSKLEKITGGIGQAADFASMAINPTNLLGKGVELGAKTANVLGKVTQGANLVNMGLGVGQGIASGQGFNPMQLLQMGMTANNMGMFGGSGNGMFGGNNAGASQAGTAGGSPFGTKGYGGYTHMADGGQTGLVPINVEGANFSEGFGPDAKKGELLVLNGKIYKNYVGRPPHPAEGQDPMGNDDAPEGLIVIPKARTKEYLEAGLIKRKQMEISIVSQQQHREMKNSNKMEDGGKYSRKKSGDAARWNAYNDPYTVVAFPDRESSFPGDSVRVFPGQKVSGKMPYMRDLGNLIGVTPDSYKIMTMPGTRVYQDSTYMYANPKFLPRRRQGDGGYYSFGMGEMGMGFGGSTGSPMGNSDRISPETFDDMMTYKKGGWIQKATASIKRRGTEGVCTGSKFGSSSCPPGSRRYNLAKTFRKMAKARKHEYGGFVDPVTGSDRVMYRNGAEIGASVMSTPFDPDILTDSKYNDIEFSNLVDSRGQITGKFPLGRRGSSGNLDAYLGMTRGLSRDLDKEYLNSAGIPMGYTMTDWEETSSPVAGIGISGGVNDPRNPRGFTMEGTKGGVGVSYEDNKLSPYLSGTVRGNYNFGRSRGKYDQPFTVYAGGDAAIRPFRRNDSYGMMSRPAEANEKLSGATNMNYYAGLQGNFGGTQPFVQYGKNVMTGQPVTQFGIKQRLSRAMGGNVNPNFSYGRAIVNRGKFEIGGPTNVDKSLFYEGLNERAMAKNGMITSMPMRRRYDIYSLITNNANKFSNDGWGSYYSRYSPEILGDDSLETFIKQYDANQNLIREGNFGNKYVSPDYAPIQENVSPSYNYSGFINNTFNTPSNNQVEQNINTPSYNPYIRRMDSSAGMSLSGANRNSNSIGALKGIPQGTIGERYMAGVDESMKAAFPDLYSNKSYNLLGSTQSTSSSTEGNRYANALEDIAGLAPTLFNLAKSFDKVDELNYLDYETPAMKFRRTRFDPTPYNQAASRAQYALRQMGSGPGYKAAIGNIGAQAGQARSQGYMDWLNKEILREQGVDEVNLNRDARNRMMKYQVDTVNQAAREKPWDYAAKATEQLAQTFGRDPMYFRALAGQKPRQKFTGWRGTSQTSGGSGTSVNWDELRG